MKVSLILPSIRTHLLEDFYESALYACRKHKWELVIVGPFDPPDRVLNQGNVFYRKDYGTPTRCTQIAVQHAQGSFIYNCVDDGIFTPDCIDQAVMEMEMESRLPTVINMRYRESLNADRDEFPESYWSARNTKIGKNLPGIKDHWKIALHFFMYREYYNLLGGMDCRFEYVNHAAHDLMFRIQESGGVVRNSTIEGLICSHMPEETGDHGPIHNAQLTHDQDLFDSIYKNPDVAKERIKLPLHAWEVLTPACWERRFPSDKPLPTTYKEMMNEE